jgi:hypothetical protein
MHQTEENLPMQRIFLALIALSIAVTGSTGVRASNKPILEYLLVLNGHGKPQTYFKHGAAIGFRVEVYAPGQRAGGLSATWRASAPRYLLWSKSAQHGFRGPTRGNLFTLTDKAAIPRGAPATRYTVTVRVTVAGYHLSRSEHFWVRG